MTIDSAGSTDPAVRERRPDRVVLAIVLAVIGTVFFAGGDIGARLMKETAPAALATWMRYFVLLVIALPYALLSKGPQVLRPKNIWLQFGRGGGAVLSTTFFILGLGPLTVSDATAIHYVTPIITMVLSVFLLDEKVGPRRWVAAVVGFVGVLLIARPGTSSFQPAAIFPICSATAFAFGAVCIRMIRDDPPETTFLWTGIVGTVVSTLIVIPVFHVPTGIELVYGLIGSLSFVAAQFLLIVAFRMGPLSILAPITYAQLISAGILAYLVFGEVPTHMTLFGAALIAGSGLYSAHRERVKRAEAQKKG
jgi:drug/metabolite transporter (DMT)-like permease